MPQKMTPAQAMTAALQSVPVELAPGGGLMPLLVQAAQQLQTPQQAEIILNLLGGARFLGVDPPPSSLSLPADHTYHLANSCEWYWFSANLSTADGFTLAVLVSFEAIRMFGQDIQSQAQWTDEDCQLLGTVATVVISPPGGGGASYFRRSPNVNWGCAEDGSVGFPTLEAFTITSGTDSFQGSPQVVLPGVLTISDGELQVSLTFAPAEGVDPPYFLQGADGATPAPRQGLYYSWPQCAVSGTIQVPGGGEFQVNGTGWIDHQLMMDPVSAEPSPIEPQPKGLSNAFDGGWNWCQFNLTNGDAFTGIALQQGPTYSARPTSHYGFYVQRTGSTWTPLFCENAPGAGTHWNLDQFLPVLDNALQATMATYISALPPVPSQPEGVSVILQSTPLHPDGSFYNPDNSIGSEIASTVLGEVTIGGTTRLIGGTGYVEAIGFEVPAAYRARALAILGVGPLET